MSLLPPSLSPGDTIAVVAPAGTLEDPARYYQGCSLLMKMGFEVLSHKRQWFGAGFLAGEDEMRAKELMAAWYNPDIKAIFALRGGYGSIRILDKLDYNAIRSRPKMFVGFSDISILINTIVQQTGQICLHGPVVASLADCDQVSLDRLYNCLVGNYRALLKEDIEILHPAPPVTGILVGGNLSSLATLIGTPWDIDCREKILFIEDVNEPLYRLDRLLTHCSLADKFNEIKGIIVGDCCQAEATERRDQQRIQEYVWNRILELVEDPAVPVWGKFPAGHNSRNIALPIGMRCTMDSETGTIRFGIGRDDN